MNVTELASLLEFHLGQMTAKNDHHRFERLCGEVARRRIAVNIVVATGPVGSGGDGGRDGETFDTELPDEACTWFSVRATTAHVAMACSARKDYKKKIPTDVRNISLSRDREFDSIVFFSTRTIPSGDQIRMRKKYAASGLAIWDRLAIARALAEPDLHWVAQHYLDLPAKLFEGLEPDGELGWELNDEDYLVPGQKLVEALEIALALNPAETHVASSPIADLQRRHVALHLALGVSPITDQHAYELSRQSDESARFLRRVNSSGADALKRYGILGNQG